MHDSAFVQWRDYKDTFCGTQYSTYQEVDTSRFITMRRRTSSADDAFDLLSDHEKHLIEEMDFDF